MTLVREVTRELVRNGKKTIKQDVIDVVEATCSAEEFEQFKEFLRERGITVVKE